jgi:hypothetical protein
MCETQTRGKEGVTKNHNSMLIAENYKNEHNCRGHGVVGENPKNKTLGQKPIPHLNCNLRVTAK